MARGEIYVQLAANHANDPKVRKLVRYGADARGCRDLFVQMICYCKELLSDGFVPEEQVGLICYPDTWENAQRDAGRLVDVGLIERVEDGYYVTNFLKRNKSRLDVEEEAEAKSTAAIRTNHVRWHEGKEKVDPKCPLCKSSRVAPAIAGATGGAIASGSRSRVASDSTESESESETKSETESQLLGSPSENRAARSRRAPAARSTRIPEDFTADTAMIQWARENTPLVGAAETNNFVDYWLAESGTRAEKVSWVAAWRKWMRKAQTDAEERAARHPARPKGGTQLVERGGMQMLPRNAEAFDIVAHFQELEAGQIPAIEGSIA